MKKLRHIIAALAIVIFSGSCQQEKLNASKGVSTVTFSVKVPEIAGTKAYGSVEKINNLVFAIYKTTATDLETAQYSISEEDLVYKENPKALGKTTAFTSEGNASITLELINNQNYIILFWAQVDETWVSSNDFDLTNISYPKVNGKNTLIANDDKYSAFYGRAYIAKVTGSRTEPVKLYRPFAQLNIASSNPKDYNIEVTYSSVSVYGAAASFNVATKTAANDTTNVKYTRAENPEGIFNTKYPHYIASNYLFANGNIRVEYNIETAKHGTIENYDSPITNVPVAQNYRTNILGNLLSSDVTYNVSIEDDWDEPAKEVHPLYLAAAVGGAYTLEADVDLTNEAAPLVVTSNLTLNLNGKNLKGGKVYDAAASMTGIDIAAISVDNGATLTIEGEGNIEGSSYGVYAKNGTLNIKSGNFTAETSAVQVGAATVNIEGGTFSNTDEDKRYTINCLDANWKDGTSKVNITGGTFIDFNPANNHAEGVGTNFCAEGYTTYKKGNVYVVAPVKLVGTTADLTKAFSDTYDTAIIKLNSNLTISERLYLNEGAELHLDLNGKKILSTSDYVFVVWEGGKLVVDGDGTIETETPGSIMFYPAGDIVIESGTFIRRIPEGYTGSTSSMFVGTKPAGGWESTGVTINGGYFDCGYYDANAADIEEILAGTKSIVETDADIKSQGQPGDKNLMRVALKNNTMKMFNRSNNYFHIYGGTFVGANPAWGDEGCMLPTTPNYLRPWSYYQGALINGQTFNENGIILPEGFTITKGSLEDGRPTYTVRYTKPESDATAPELPNE